MASNKDLNKAAKAKKDEFYTMLADIEVELKHYRKHFKGKTVLCNCDDPFESNFFKYFAMNFNYLGLKKLIATCYQGSPVLGEEFQQLSTFGLDGEVPKRHPYKIEITEVIDANGDGAVDLTDVAYLLKSKKNVLTLLTGDGDFRSDECVEILKEADIVVTNPPFSLFREFVAQLVAYEKQFLIIGNVNAITYKEIFPLIKDNKLWMGYSIHSGDREFRVPDDYPLEAAGSRIDDKGRKYIRVKGVRWYTNMDYVERHTDLELWKRYTPEEYPQFDNYYAINVDKVADIPCDYWECIGVPITFLDKFNPDQFEIVNANDIRRNQVMIRPKAHGLIKDQEASISICSQSLNVERERERETNHVCKNRHPQTTVEFHTSSPAVTPASTESESTPESLFADAIRWLKSQFGYTNQEIIYYSGIMGVPITFLDKYNPNQFEILGCTESEGKGLSYGIWIEDSKVAQPLVHHERKYKRIFIRKR